MNAEDEQEDMARELILQQKRADIKKRFNEDVCQEHYGIAIVKDKPCSYAIDGSCPGFHACCTNYVGHNPNGND